MSIGKAMFSAKTTNWILTKSQNSYAILLLIKMAQFLHFVSGQKIELEVIVID